MAIPTVTTPATTPITPPAGTGGASPTTYTGNGQPTLPEGSVVNQGNGPRVTPPSDTVLYTRVGNDAPVSTPPDLKTNSIGQGSQLGQLDAGAQTAVQNVVNRFATKVQDFKSGAGANNVGIQNALAASLGAAGGTTSGDRAAVAGKTNKVTTDALDRQKAASLQAISAGLVNAQNKIRTGDATQDNANIKTYNADTAKEAKVALTNISSVLGNLTYQQFKQADPNTFKSVLGLAGGDEAELELLYNNAMSNNGSGNKPTYHWENGQAFEQIGGNISRRPDLDTKTPAAQNGSSKLQVIGGTAYLFPTDAKGGAVIDPEKPLSYYAYAQVPGKASTTTPPIKASAAAKEMATYLAPQKGSDGYISPNDYQTALQAWVGQGFTSASFKTYFSGYKNPNDSYLDDAKKTTKTSSTSNDSTGTGGIPGVTP